MKHIFQCLDMVCHKMDICPKHKYHPLTLLQCSTCLEVLPCWNNQTPNPSNTNEPVKIPTNEFTSNDTSFSTPEIPDITPKEDSSAKMDFSNIIIKKV